jgi:ketosteroid isomerase-like protein
MGTSSVPFLHIPSARAAATAGLLAALLVGGGPVSAQLIPGGRPVDVGRLRGDFYNQMIAKVREVMDGWQGAWRKDDEASMGPFYTRDAFLLQPGGLPIRGREQIVAFSRDLAPETSGLRAGMQDLEACEGFAYFSGYYNIDPRTADRPPSSGRHFTVIEPEGGDWRIRFQAFLPDSGAVPLPRLLAPELLDPLTADQIRLGPRGLSRYAAFGDAQYVLLAFRDAWKRRDAADAATFFAQDAWVRLPGETSNQGGSLPLEDRLREGMARFGEILTVELDFDRRDRLSYTFGRYHAVGTDGDDRPGHFLMLLRNTGYGWLIRSLAFF